MYRSKDQTDKISLYLQSYLHDEAKKTYSKLDEVQVYMMLVFEIGLFTMDIMPNGVL